MADSLSEIVDNSYRPQDDFFAYANSRWLKANPIPANESRWGSFYVLRDQAWKALSDIYEELQTGEYQSGSIEQQARDLYFSGMHLDDQTEASLKLLKTEVARLDAIKDTAELSAAFGYMERSGINAPFCTIVDADDYNSAQHILRFHQEGLSLPNRDYYLDKAAKMAKIREQYVEFAAKVYAEFDFLDGDFQKIIELETKLAAASTSNADLRDPHANYHLTSFDELKSSYQNIDWDKCADGMHWQPKAKLSVDQLAFFEVLNREVAATPIDIWKQYLKWHLTISCMSKISSRLAELYFEFFGKVLGGTTEITPLWKRVVTLIDSIMGEGVGQLYCQKHFPESSKKLLENLVEEVRDEYRRRLEKLTWMEPATRKLAIKKLDNMKVLIGYPDKWRDFTKLEIVADCYLANFLNGKRFTSDYYMQRLEEPTSRDDWFMYPQTVNAYHDPNRLVICFPAAILQAPFFDPTASEAANFGGIGTVIGHELTHGFDDQGCEFDAEGNLKQWQSPTDRQKFQQLTQKVIDHADTYEVLPGLFQQGKLVVGETIADIGGIDISFAAFRRKRGEAIFQKTDNAFSQAEEFFINYAQTENGETRTEKKREMALVDPHPESEYRVNGVLANTEAFYQAYDIKETDKMYLDPAKRGHIW